ncbi:unnamed protein product [Brassica oleracea var. botrytis]|uniref:(rape) hypothetical protein n=1 Tax=Brassica napus TaxID=3708 RepID=A0A078G767_BRANA|nr:unnamed protein product [Brassica napus]CDY20852.1 BnaC05g26400D [Brassica napus]
MKRNMRTKAAPSRPDQEEVWVCFLIDKLLYNLSRKEMGAAKMAQSKLQDNLKKLQGISLKMMEMKDTAKVFHFYCKRTRCRVQETELKILALFSLVQLIFV